MIHTVYIYWYYIIFVLLSIKIDLIITTFKEKAKLLTIDVQQVNFPVLFGHYEHFYIKVFKPTATNVT